MPYGVMNKSIVISLFCIVFQSAYGDFALFFHDAYGGDVIAVLWKPDIQQDREFQVFVLSSCHF